jgi:hypothetical protein
MQLCRGCNMDARAQMLSTVMYEVVVPYINQLKHFWM